MRASRLPLWEAFPPNNTPLPTAELTGAFTPVREMVGEKPRIEAKAFHFFFPNRRIEPIYAGLTGKRADCVIVDDIVEPPKPVTADALLTEAAVTLKARGKERDTEAGERSMARCVDAFNCFTDRDLSEEEGWLFMQCLKQSRMRGGGFKADDYMDSIGYASLQAETALRDHQASTT